MTAAASTSVLPAANLAATPPNAPPAAVRSAAFAEMLDARRAEAAHEPAPPEPPKADPSTTEEASAVDHAQATRSADEARNRHLRVQRHVGTRPHAAESAHVHEPRTPAEPAETASGVASMKVADDTEPAVDPALTDWLASLNLPPAQPAPTAAAATETVDPQPHSAAGGAAGDLPEAEPDVPAAATPGERGTPRRGAAHSGSTDAMRRQGTEDLKSAHASARAEGREAAQGPTPFQTATEQAAALPTRGQALAGDLPKADLAAAVQAMSTAGPLTERPAAEANAPAVLHMATPADAPEFPRMLGAQLSVLAKDGVQQAELHLNPADMGPISVQIALDGDLAKVDFGADSAATREIIEGGLPELAAALRDAGFTLSGGGVHSQAQQQGQRGQEGGRAGVVPPDNRGDGVSDAAQAPRAPVRAVRAGGIDLYA